MKRGAEAPAFLSCAGPEENTDETSHPCSLLKSPNLVPDRRLEEGDRLLVGVGGAGALPGPGQVAGRLVARPARSKW